MWLSQGVSINEGPTGVDYDLQIVYNGELNSNRVEIYIRYSTDSWVTVSEKPLGLWRNGSMSVDIQTDGKPTLCFCFRDADGNWDNNYGNNWEVRVAQGAVTL